MDNITAEELDQKTRQCIRCGFCLDACPTFRITGQETLSPRGRIYLVRSWQQDKIELDKHVLHALDSCLGCRACETACPSGVEYGSILEMARTEIESRSLRTPAQSFARRQLLRVLTTPGQLAASLQAGRLLRPLTGGKLPGFAARLLSGGAQSSVQLPVPQEEAAVHTLPPLTPALHETRFKVGMVAGCVMKVLFSRTNHATASVLAANGCDVLCPPAAECCGALHIHAGQHEDALQKARRLLDAFEPHLPELDAVVINSAGCGSTLREYDKLLQHDDAYREKAKLFTSKVRDISEWLVEIGIAPPSAPLSRVVSYHDACHLAHGQRIKEQPRQLLRSIPGLQLVEMEEADTCCGSAGIYNIVQPEMARKLLIRKIEHIRATGATHIATANPGCLAWIEQGLMEAGLDISISHPVEILAEAYSKSGQLQQ